MISLLPHPSPASEDLQALLAENEALKQENEDLHIALTTIAEHGDMIESLLNNTNVKLKAEIAERQRAESRLQNILDLISRQKDDLEIIVETIMQHGDVVDAQWREKLVETAELINLDGLTQIANRRRFDQHLQDQWELLAITQEPLALVIGDIDHFKQYNDFYGHLGGDECLRRIALAMSACLRNPYDLFARYGGEEFVAILPNTNEVGGYQAALRMQATLNLLAIPHQRSPIVPQVTMSFGLAVMIPHPDRSSLELIAMADQHLYQAKRTGKNRIVSSGIV
ncbi:MAG: diguanylate cyclase [Microcystaceae cyanobacterium]